MALDGTAVVPRVGIITPCVSQIIYSPQHPSVPTDDAENPVVSPCHDGTHACEAPARCQPGVGTEYTCECPAGYRREGWGCQGQQGWGKLEGSWGSSAPSGTTLVIGIWDAGVSQSFTKHRGASRGETGAGGLFIANLSSKFGVPFHKKLPSASELHCTVMPVKNSRVLPFNKEQVSFS